MTRALPVAAAVLLYLRVVTFAFVWDDWQIIVDNPLIKSWRTMPSLLSSPDNVPGITTGYFRPVTYLSFLFDYSTGAGNPALFHLTNLLLFAAVIFLLYHVARSFADRWTAFASALIFACHPINAETVSFVAGGRNTLLAGLFILLSLLSYQHRRPLPTALFFLLSLLSKEQAILFPVFLYLTGYLQAEERPRVTGFLCLMAALIFLLVRGQAIGWSSGFAISFQGLAERLLVAPVLTGRYIVNLFFPFWLKIPYSSYGVDRQNLLFSGITIIFFLLSLMWSRKNRRTLLLPAWVFVMLLPVLNVVNPLGVITMADRYAFLPGMAAAVAVALGLRCLNARWRSLLLVILCLLLAYTAYTASSHWRNNEALYRRMILDAPDMHVGYFNLGMHLYDRGATSEAAVQFEKALPLAPSPGDTTGTVLYLAMTRWELGALEDAMTTFRLLPENEFHNPTVVVTYARLLESAGRMSERDSLLQEAGMSVNAYREKLAGFAGDMLAAARIARSSGDGVRGELLERRAQLYE